MSRENWHYGYSIGHGRNSQISSIQDIIIGGHVQDVDTNGTSTPVGQSSGINASISTNPFGTSQIVPSASHRLQQINSQTIAQLIHLQAVSDWNSAQQMMQMFPLSLLSNLSNFSLAHLGDGNHDVGVPAAIYTQGSAGGNQPHGVVSSHLASLMYSGQGIGAGGVLHGNVARTTSHLPMSVAHPSDRSLLSDHQMFLRQQIEIFAADDSDLGMYTRGRNRNISLGQVGIRCRHCSHLPAAQRVAGARYFPATTLGLYQAAQNMSSAHIQCGRCPCMSEAMNQHFIELIPTKFKTSTGGRVYWSNCAKEMGLIDTEDGIRFRNED